MVGSGGWSVWSGHWGNGSGGPYARSRGLGLGLGTWGICQGTVTGQGMAREAVMVDGVQREQEVPLSLPNGTHSARAVTHAFFYIYGTLGTKIAIIIHRRHRENSRETRGEREREISP